MSDSLKPVAPKSPEQIRETILNLANQYIPKVPEVLKQMSKDSPPFVQMAIMGLRPILPKLSESLLVAIDNAPDEKINEFVKFVNEVAVWLNNESESSPVNESL